LILRPLRILAALQVKTAGRTIRIGAVERRRNKDYSGTLACLQQTFLGSFESPKVGEVREIDA